MPKYHPQDSWDGQTNAPSQNFIYDFDLYRFYVRDEWREVLSHDIEGAVQSGSVHDLADAFSQGCEVKVGVRGLCTDLAEDPATAIDHEMFGADRIVLLLHSAAAFYRRDASNHPCQACRAFGLREPGLGFLVGYWCGRTDRLYTDAAIRIRWRSRISCAIMLCVGLYANGSDSGFGDPSPIDRAASTYRRIVGAVFPTAPMRCGEKTNLPG